VIKRWLTGLCQDGVEPLWPGRSFLFPWTLPHGLLLLLLIEARIGAALEKAQRSTSPGSWKSSPSI